MMNNIKHIVALTAVGLLTISNASAAPTFDTFAPLPDLVAGGTPGKDVAISSSGGLTLGLSAQQRYSNPALADDNNGTFFAETGSNYGNPALPGGPGPSSYEGSTWNFSFYINNNGITGTTADPFTYVLSYGLAGGTVYSFNPLADTDADNYTSGTYQDSQNLMFGTFGGAVNGFAALYDPNADATYEFLLEAKNAAGAVVESVGITVVVGKGSSVPDAGSTLALMGAVFVGIAGLRRKFKA